MKSSLFATGLLGVAFTALWYFSGGPQPLPMARATDAPRVAAPVAHENLSVYFVHGRDTVSNAKLMSLQEALEREVAVVHETSDVNTLAVENRSDEYELFIQSGDIVKGGKQDRMAATDMLLPPKSGLVPLPAHCVEQGRWTGRGSEDAAKFRSSEKFAVGREMKIANLSGQQGEVWQTVRENQGKLATVLKAKVAADASPSSFQLTLESRAVAAKVAEYEAAIKRAGERHDDIIGVVFVVNGQVSGAEVYASNAMFRKAWPKLLNSAAVEAVADRTDKPTAAPSAGEIEYFLAQAANPEPAEGGSSRVADRDRTQARELYRARGRAVVDNVELFQTEGRLPEAIQTEGRAAGAQGGGGGTSDVISEVQDLRPRVQVANPAGGQLGVVTDPGLDSRIEPAPRLAPPAGGNRLNSNFTENRSTLMVESRDPARANTVIHRSYVKK